jgi:hypothetical protein
VADGFTFAIISSINNITDCGGGSCGEYMGYAGPGTTGNGLRPPKIAVEFDPYYLGTSNLCSSTFPYPTLCGSRSDSLFDSPYKHASFTYWGTNSPECTVSPTVTSYDDNRHGRGDANNPKNPESSDTQGNGFQTYDFVNFGTLVGTNVRRWSFRLEIDRVDGTREYKLRAWLKPYAVYIDTNVVALDDTSKKFNKNGDYPPDFQQTITLTSDWHSKFDRMLFGWTQGTGGGSGGITQTVTIRNIKVDFKNINDF